MEAYLDQTHTCDNETVKFFEKVCTAADLKYAMETVRNMEGNSKSKEFQRRALEHQKKTAEEAREKRDTLAKKRWEEEERMKKVGIEYDRGKVESMTISHLKDQFNKYKKELQDEVLAKVSISKLTKRDDLLTAVLGALARHSPSLENLSDRDIMMEDNLGNQDSSEQLSDNVEMYHLALCKLCTF
ncbi:hypothetical protein GYMLUDRAFT_65274 [Collybiopsis luxurians FD-317 M1]|uniref:Uncharacterized protein n=1 Tax=Collybiopsis luxurians FD-317 M1 TaxID=944289 RepID=A0A0D0BYF2_9AGAR|nr:hypothetical protein GYMLUDRAFT_65274 [Collybiopsis luxurians FD-317 M1]